MIKIRLMCLLAALLAVVAAAPLSAQQPPDILYLKFNEGAGSTTADHAVPGTGAAPTLFGGAGWDIVTSIIGAAALKTGPNPGDIAATNVPFSLSGSWTIECAFLDLNGGTFNTLFGDSSAGGFACNKIVGFAGTDLTLSGGGLNAVTITNFGVAAWGQVAYVHDAVAANIKVYLNGNLLNTVAQPAGLTITGSSTSGLKIGGDSVGGPIWTGSIDEFRIWGSARSQADIQANLFSEIAGIPDDLGLQSLDSPLAPAQDCAALGALETIGFTVVNAGANAIAPGTSFIATYSVNGATPVVESFSIATALANGQTASFNFAAPADLMSPGERQIALTISYPADLNAGNDALTETFAPGVGLVTSFPFVENFDSLPAGSGTTPPAGWTQDQNDASGSDGDWRFRDGPTPTVNTGPDFDHTTGVAGQGHYAHVEDSQANHAQVNLLSPCLDLAGLASPRVSLWLHSRNDQSPTTTFENSFSLDVILPSGTVVMDAIGPIGHQGPAWQQHAYDLSPFAGVVVQLRLRGRSDGGGGKHDLAVDDIVVADLSPGIGQAPQAGLATLDLNNALSPLLGAVSTGDNGPYATTASVGGPLVYTLGGVPGQPVILLFGPLNPVAATFPMIGQMDIGGLPDPLTGIPMGIQVLGNGHNPLDFIDLLFVIGGSGETTLAFVLPTLPPGVIGAFQSANLTGPGSPIALSNAVELTIL